MAVESGLARSHARDFEQLHALAIDAEFDGGTYRGAEDIERSTKRTAPRSSDVQNRAFAFGKLIGKRDDHRMVSRLRLGKTRAEEPHTLGGRQALFGEKCAQIVVAVPRKIMRNANAAPRSKRHLFALPGRLRSLGRKDFDDGRGIACSGS